MIDGALEDNLLTLLCWSETHSADVLMRLDNAAQAISLVSAPGREAAKLSARDMFSTRAYRQIAKIAIGHIEKFSLPPRAHLRDLLEGDLKKGEDGKLIRRVLDEMERIQAEMQADFVLGQLDSFTKSRSIAMRIESASDALEAGHVDLAEEALRPPVGAVQAGQGIYLHEADKMLGFLDKREEDFFSSGVEELDKRGIRPARKTMYLMIAPPKYGKSWSLIEIGKRGLQYNHSVLHITLENSEELTAQRYCQALFAMTREEADVTIQTRYFPKDSLGRGSGLDTRQITAKALNAGARSSVAKRLKAFKSRKPFLIKEFPTGTLTLSHLDAYLDGLKRSGFEPDLLLIDYPDLMAIDAANTRTSTGGIYKGLRGIAVRRNLALATVTQTGREGESARIVRPTMVSEDWSKVMTADTIVTYSRTPDEKRLNLARLMVANARNAADGYLVMIAQSYTSGQFCLDSSYMSKYLGDEVQRLSGHEAEDDADKS